MYFLTLQNLLSFMSLFLVLSFLFYSFIQSFFFFLYIFFFFLYLFTKILLEIDLSLNFSFIFFITTFCLIFSYTFSFPIFLSFIFLSFIPFFYIQFFYFLTNFLFEFSFSLFVIFYQLFFTIFISKLSSYLTQFFLFLSSTLSFFFLLLYILPFYTTILFINYSFFLCSHHIFLLPFFLFFIIYPTILYHTHLKSLFFSFYSTPGIGYACSMIVFFLDCNYNIILTWSLYYLFSSFSAVLPWSSCGNEWNTVNCTEFESIRNKTLTARNTTMHLLLDDDITNASFDGAATEMTQQYMRKIVMDPVTEFWE